VGQGEAKPDWETSLRPWRWVSGLLALAQLPLIVVALTVLFLFDESARVWAYAAAGALLGLDLAKWAVEREALRRTPNVRSEESYATLPLNRRQRRLVALTLVLMPLTAALLLTATALDVDVAVVAVLIIVAASGAIPLYRVWRHNSWLAISRLPARPRHPAVARQVD
jgi:hypothetical protein